MNYLHRPKPAQAPQWNNKPAQAQALHTNSKPAFTNFPLATRPPNFPGAYPPQIPHPTVPVGNAIHIPSNRDIELVKRPETNPTWETFNIQEEANLYDPRTSAAEAEKALRQLVEDSHNDNGNDEVDMDQAIVDGFRDGVTLLPHQVLGRIWMKERETGKKMGGILADDMG